MSNITLLAALAIAGTTLNDGIPIGARFVAAIQSKADFNDADFVRAVGASDKLALRRFGQCKVTHLDYGLTPDSVPGATSPDFDEIVIMFGCKGVSRNTPVGITLHLEGGRINTIETHNADLMRAE